MTGSEGTEPAIVDPRPRLPRAAGDVIVAVLVLMLTFAPSPGDAYQPPAPLTIGLAVVAVLTLPLRRRWPIPVLAGVVVLFAVAAFTGALNPGLALAVAVGMFGVTNRLTRGAGVLATAVTVVVVVGLCLVAVLPDWDPRVIQYGLTTLIGAAIGDATRSRRDYITAITERAERAEQTREAEARRRVSEERLRIARDLHDAVAHQISVISLNAGVASSALASRPGRPERAEEALVTIRSAARTVLGEIGDLMDVLRADESADPAAARTAPQPCLDQLDRLVQGFRDGGLDVTVRTEGDLRSAPGAPSRVAYRVVQESLTNAHKHGAEHRAHVLLATGADALTVVVTNPVDDAVRDAPAPGSRLGLTGLRERVASVRGTVETGPVPGGWRVLAKLPIRPAASPRAPGETGAS